MLRKRRLRDRRDAYLVGMEKIVHATNFVAIEAILLRPPLKRPLIHKAAIFYK